jgi:hypothetical protein
MVSIGCQAFVLGQRIQDQEFDSEAYNVALYASRQAIVDSMQIVDTPAFERLYAQFGEILPKLQRVRRLLTNSDVDERITGVRALGECGEGNAEVAPLVFQCLRNLLEDDESEVRSPQEF